MEFKTWDAVEENLKERFPSDETRPYHEITWWLDRELTIEEWTELDNRQSEIFDDMNIDVSGVAGPIPL